MAKKIYIPKVTGDVSIKIVSKVIVQKDPTDTSCTNITLNKTSLYFVDSTPQKLVATLTPSNTTDSLTWKSNKTNIATVSTAGIVTPKADGECVITATCGSCTKTCSITVNLSGSSGDYNENYVNPTITFDATTNKAKLTKNGYTEYMDVSYIKNSGHADYVSNTTVTDSNGQTHYISLLNPNSTSAISKFRINGLVPDNGGWFDRNGGTDYEETGEMLYNLFVDPRLFYGTNFNATIKNSGLNSEYMNKALTTFNTMFPALNLTLNSSSSNEITMKSANELGDSYLGMTWAGTNGFYIELYSNALNNYSGPYESNKNYWLNTAVHELGHSLGLDDMPHHSPTIYNYSEDHAKCWYFQPNDIYAFKTLAKEQFGLDVVTSLEQSCGIRYNIAEQVNQYKIKESINMSDDIEKIRCSYIVYDNPDEKSDIIVEAELIFIEERKHIPSDGGRGIMYFDVYEIVPLNVIKGEALLKNNNKVRILKYAGINVDTNYKYKLRLLEREEGHLIINPLQGIEKN